MKRITLRQLRVFEHVARLGSMSAAAGVCHLTQPAVSMQLKALEDECGMPLTELHGRKLRLTDAGSEVANYAHKVQSLLDQLESQLAAMRGKSLGKLTVGIVSTAKYFAPYLLAAFREQHPGITFSLMVDNRAQVVRLLTDNEIDLAIMGVPPAALEARAIPFAEHPLGIVLPANHALAKKRSLSLQALADETFLVRETGSGTRAVMERYFASEKFSPTRIIQMTGNEAIKQAVIAGLGVGFLSYNTVALERRLGLLHVPRIPALPILRRWHVVHLRGKQLLPVGLAFHDFILEHGARYADALNSAPTARVNAELKLSRGKRRS